MQDQQMTDPSTADQPMEDQQMADPSTADQPMEDQQMADRYKELTACLFKASAVPQSSRMNLGSQKSNFFHYHIHGFHQDNCGACNKPVSTSMMHLGRWKDSRGMYFHKDCYLVKGMCIHCSKVVTNKEHRYRTDNGYVHGKCICKVCTKPFENESSILTYDDGSCKHFDC